MPEAFGIRNKETGASWRANSGKSVWAKPGHAKAAWARSHYSPWDRKHDGVETATFNDQDKWEVFKIGQDEVAQLTVAVKLLREVIYAGVLTYDNPVAEDLEGDIINFLSEVK